jgi:hypothetical protein
LLEQATRTGNVRITGNHEFVIRLDGNGTRVIIAGTKVGDQYTIAVETVIGLPSVLNLAIPKSLRTPLKV